MAETPEHTHRRIGDDENDDFRDLRERSGHRRGLNGHTKWVVGAVGTGGIALLGFFAIQYHERLTGDISQLQRTDTVLQGVDTQFSSTIAQNHTEIEVLKAHLQAMQEQMNRLEKNQEQMLVKLDRR